MSGDAQLFEVSRLATLLADRILDAQMMSRPVANEHVRALLEAALLLREYGQELPSLLVQIMHGVDKPEADVTPGVQQKADATDNDVSRLAWLFRPFQGAKNHPG
jgi:hypothetical protein